MFAFIAALIGIGIVVSMWRLLDPRKGTDTAAQQPQAPQRPTPRTGRRTGAPDDDPEFLRELGRKIGKSKTGEDDPQPV